MIDKDQREFLSNYTSFSGSDLLVTFGSKIIGTLQQISYAIQREKVPVFTVGDANPRSFSRGKRGIAGSLVLATFDRDELHYQMQEIWNEIAPAAMYTADGYHFKSGVEGLNRRLKGRFDKESVKPAISTSDIIAQELQSNTDIGDAKIRVPAGFGLITKNNLQYADQIPPFDVTLTFANEYGQACFMKIYDLELLNEASGVSVDSSVLEKNYTWIARSISPLYKGVQNSGGSSISDSRSI
jgi:hypothetical protein